MFSSFPSSMGSVAQLRKPHYQAQGERMEHVRKAYDTFFDYSVPADIDPALYREKRQASASKRPEIHPYEGYILPHWEALSNDPVGTQTAWHDVVPREVLLEEDPTTTDRSGSDVICRDVSAILRTKLDEHGVLARYRDTSQPFHEHFRVRDAMTVHVVNVVHTSYFNSKLSSAFIWRKVAFLGCQENNVHASQKISYRAPFKVTHMLFPPGRVLDTGAYREDIAHIVFFFATLEYLRRAGMTHLRVLSRESQNVVAKSWMPNGDGLLLDLMQRRHEEHVTYDHGQFAGALFRHWKKKKVKLLAFQAGSIVYVGPKDVPAMQATAESTFDILANNTDTPANRDILARFRRFGDHDDDDDDDDAHDGDGKDKRATAAAAAAAVRHNNTKRAREHGEATQRRPKRPRIGGTHY